MKYMLRKAIRRACQRGVLGFYYPADFSIRTCVSWRLHRHERATLDYLKTVMNRGDVFVDIGAHVGYYAAYVGQLVGADGFVYAFEPHPTNYKLLIRNCSRLRQVKTLWAAVSDSSGEALLFEHSTSSSSHGLTDLSGSGKSVPVRKLALDEWSRENKIDHINAVLIDVEGHELSVLRGMWNTIEKNANLIIILEYCPSNWPSQGEEADVLIKEIHKMDLTITRALGHVRTYAMPEHESEAIVKRRLDEILRQEASEARSNYVNIVLRKHET